MTGRDRGEQLLPIGGQTVGVDVAQGIVFTYVHGTDGIYSYPSYDLFQGGAPDELSDGDLLTPALLNANPGIDGFAALQANRKILEAALAQVPVDVSLVDATEGDLDAVAALYRVLDEQHIMHIRGTTLSKVLHRKRPALIPLHDESIRRCYQSGPKAPIPVDRTQSWESYMRDITRCVRADLQAGIETWERLCQIAPDGSITAVRCFDMVAWHVGKDLPG